MARPFEWFKNLVKGPLVANTPPELSQCEFECRSLECSQGEWLNCKKRIRSMKKEVAFSPDGSMTER
jgi:hypothetical protein